MRPESLFGLFSPITTLRGVGQKTAVAIGALCGGRVIDVLKHIPREYTLRHKSPNIAVLSGGDIPILQVEIQQHIAPPRHSKTPYRLVVKDNTGSLDLLYFKAGESYMKKKYPVGETFFISGKIEIWNDKKQIIHPDYIVKDKKTIPLCSPIYAQSGKVSSKILHKISTQCVDKIIPLNEWIHPTLLQKYAWTAFDMALKTLHTPTDTASIEPARRRLAYDEILASQITIALSRQKRTKNIGVSIISNGQYGQQLLNALPYDLTNAQKESVAEIYADMQNTTSMNRLLQGDVGAGKTLVALLAMLHTAQSGHQSVLLAPTEVLAIQHYQTINALLTQSGIPVRAEILTGKIKGKARTALLNRLKSGQIDILIGTHAVFQEGVSYKNLAFCVIDEQHRFGVEQRASLMAKGQYPHVLSMTATPIPRTLLMTAFGDMDTSKLYEKPVGRKPIDTRVIPIEKVDEIAHALHRVIQSGQQIYWVCPLVEESEYIDLTATEDRYTYLSRLFGKDTVCMVHGKMKSDEKQQAMDNFNSGNSRIMVATTVIEVGVNVPNATVMIIEQAERFGLSQLHQLRGRVGRSSDKSSCLLLYKSLNNISKKRLKVIRNTEDGFEIAEQDLKLRGPGDILGTQQSGIPTMAFTHMLRDKDLLEIARKDAKYILNQDPNLSNIQGQNLRTLLYIFEMEKSLIGI